MSAAVWGRFLYENVIGKDGELTIAGSRAFEFEQAGGEGGDCWRCPVRDLRSSNGTIVDGTLLKPKTKGKKSLPVGGSHERSVQLTSGVSTVEVWLNGVNRAIAHLLTCKGIQGQLLLC